MTDPVRRAPWQRGLQRNWNAPYSRSTRSTLLSLAPLMTADGELRMARQEMADAIGVPRRSVDRHLRVACDLGWLELTHSGCRHRVASYQATLPVEAVVTRLADARKVRKSGAHSARSHTQSMRAMLFAHWTAQCAPVGGALNKTRERSDHDGVDLCFQPRAKRFRRSHLSYAARCANQRNLTLAAPPPRSGRPNPTPAAHRRRPSSGSAPVLADLRCSLDTRQLTNSPSEVRAALTPQETA